MALTFQDLDGSQAADVNQALRQVTGYGIVFGGEPHEGGKPFAVDVREATTYIDGEEVSTAATSINLVEYAEEYDDPRKVIIYIASDGEFHVAAGEPATPKPQGRSRFQTFEPSPPDFRDMPGVPVAEVWLGAHSQHVTDEDIRDRRLNAGIETRVLSAETVDFDVLIDGSGAEKTRLVDAADTYDPEDVKALIDADAGHGTDASHEYFSGSHSDLFAVAFGDHHARYTDDEAYSAISGSVDLADLTATPGTTPGYHLELDGDDVAWTNPPMAEAPLLLTESITHTGGSETTVTIEGITPTQTAGFELGVAVGVETSPAWTADYAYSVETAYRWDDAQNSIEADLSLTWDIDPGAGNDLPLQVAVYEMTPEVVTSMYDDGRATRAMAGEDLSLSELAIGQRFGMPVYGSPADAPMTAVGETILATDPDTGVFGAFISDGAGWNGPYSAGVTSLAELEIDTAADWAGYQLTNVGESTADDGTGMLRAVDVDWHASQSGAHHTKTVSSDIDHAQMTGIHAAQHHMRYGDDEALDAAVSDVVSQSIGATTIPGGQSARVHGVVAGHERMSVRRAGMMNEDGSASNLRLEIENLESGELLYSQASELAEGSAEDPLASIEGPAAVEIRIRNQRSSTVAAGGEVSYVLEPSEYLYGSWAEMYDDSYVDETVQRRGVELYLRRRVLGFEVTLSSQLSGATAVYIQEPMNGAVRAKEDISGLSAGDSIEVLAETPLLGEQSYYVSVDAEGESYQAGRNYSPWQFPFETDEFVVTKGVYSKTGYTSTENRYTIGALRALYN